MSKLKPYSSNNNDIAVLFPRTKNKYHDKHEDLLKIVQAAS